MDDRFSHPHLPALTKEDVTAIIMKDDPAWRHVIDTPCLNSIRFGSLVDCELHIKLENFQRTGAFKQRGALAKLLSLSDAERKRGVVAASAGNHAAGVAFNAQLLGVSATIVMPRHTPYVKVEQTRSYGAKVVLQGADFDEANAAALSLREEAGLTLVHPFDDPYVIAGQGTISTEMLSAASGIEVLVAPIGGGGLISGMAIAAKQLNPKIEIIGVQAELYPSMRNAVFGTNLPVGGMTLAEGIAVREPGGLTRRIVEELVSDIILVDERSLEHALSLYLNQQKILAEGAGAAGLAAILSHPDKFKGRNVGTVVCGGNIDARLLTSILMRDLHRQGRIARLRIELLDVPGQLTKASAIIAEQEGNVIEVSYHRVFNDLPAKATYMDLSVETSDSAHLNRIVAALKDNGLNTVVANY